LKIKNICKISFFLWSLNKLYYKILEAVGKKYDEYEDKNDGKYEIIIFKAYLRIYYLKYKGFKDDNI